MQSTRAIGFAMRCALGCICLVITLMGFPMACAMECAPHIGCAMGSSMGYNMVWQKSDMLSPDMWHGIRTSRLYSMSDAMDHPIYGICHGMPYGLYTSHGICHELSHVIWSHRLYHGMLDIPWVIPCNVP